jgi:hypothetical protein
MERLVVLAEEVTVEVLVMEPALQTLVLQTQAEALVAIAILVLTFHMVAADQAL